MLVFRERKVNLLSANIKIAVIIPASVCSLVRVVYQGEARPCQQIIKRLGGEDELIVQDVCHRVTFTKTDSL